MKVVILAGGFGTRFSEYTEDIPKPMIPIAENPILWHIMKIYSSYDFNDFFIACGYKADYIKDFFLKYASLKDDFTVNFSTGKTESHKTNISEDWRVTLVDTGLETMTGGRVKKMKEYIGKDKTFLLTYGDGLSNINLDLLINFHKSHKKLVTVSAVRPPARFGAVKLKGHYVNHFKEKSSLDEGWINGGFFVMEPKFLKFIKNDKTYLEREPLEKISKKKQLIAFKHKGFWQCMDTKRDKDYLERILKHNK